MARFLTLCSGSSGNAAVVEEDGRYLLVDAGISCRNLLKKLEEVGLSQEGLCALLLTHEHIDHVKGVEVFVRRTGVPVVSSVGTLSILQQRGKLRKEGKEYSLFDGGSIEIEGFLVEGFSTSHDASDCFGFSVQTPKGARMVIATDLGEISESVFLQLQKAQLVAVEANYDERLLKLSPYPPMLKQRIRSKWGHLSNEDSAAAAVALLLSGCEAVIFCHLSADNNSKEALLDSVDWALEQSGHGQLPDCEIQVAPRHQNSTWMCFGEDKKCKKSR